MNAILTHWKTTVAGVVLLVAAAAFLMGKITLEQLMGVATLAGGGGLIAAGDGKQE